LICPLIQKARKKLQIPVQKIFDKFRASDDKISLQELSAMFSFFLGFELIEEEERVLETFINETTGGRGSTMTKNDFESLMGASVKRKEYVGEEYETNQKDALLKLSRGLKKKGRKLVSEIEKY
jgi:hypothetical protein